ncbi:hypothetical protein QR685DRAFT_144769 [Neurospora intermedia]|uniref:Secreted protein n=1 Tax=Neurospora intermedia TaxID=5142 RepID=A0ABR3CXU9_NEUIN
MTLLHLLTSRFFFCHRSRQHLRQFNRASLPRTLLVTSCVSEGSIAVDGAYDGGQEMEMSAGVLRERDLICSQSTPNPPTLSPPRVPITNDRLSDCRSGCHRTPWATTVAGTTKCRKAGDANLIVLEHSPEHGHLRVLWSPSATTDDIHGPSNESRREGREKSCMMQPKLVHPVRPFPSLSLVRRTPIMPFKTRFFSSRIR